MLYNHYNNDLPVPPKGFANWRSVYASLLDFMSAYEGGAPPIDVVAQFLHNGKEARVGTDDLPIIEVPYWKMAHYAAREQAEEDAKAHQLTYHQLRFLQTSVYGNRTSGPPDPEIDVWFDYHLEQAVAKERSPNKK